MTRRTLGRVAAVVGLVAVAAGGGVLWGEWRATKRAANTLASSNTAPAAAPRSTAPSSTGEDAVEVRLSPEAIERAGIKTTAVRGQATAGSITVPGTVTSNAYRETKATALVGGIIKSVAAELGAAVSRGQTLAVVISTELADAQMKYLSAQAMLAADHQKLTRTEKLVALGAASRQELEDITAAHAAHETEVAAARQRLLLLGLSSERVSALRSADQIVSEVSVASPGSGTVVTRGVNTGQVVSAGQELFVVADLSTVWVIADLYEKDFASVRVGSEATVIVPGTPAIRGRVAYIDPRVDPATRTAKLRVEVPNRGEALRLGMFANVGFGVPSAAGTAAVIPRAAVQAVGNRSVVYVAVDGEDGRFIERVVKLGTPAGDTVDVISGLKPGERVVSEGSFFVRAEAARTRSGS
jgi:membrane fusion protein, heavy metal efflux system